MDITLLISIGGSVIGILLAIVSYFLVRLINKIDKMNDNINNINVKIGIYDTQIQSLDTKISDIQNDIEELNTKYDNLRVGFDVLNTEHRMQMSRCINHN
jgi:peptidoglycan hydrolase CwlO-like protein